jgi:hypothetical protein
MICRGCEAVRRCVRGWVRACVCLGGGGLQKELQQLLSPVLKVCL